MRPTPLLNLASWDDWRRALDDHGWSLLIIVAVLTASNIIFRRVVSGVLRRALARATQRRDVGADSLRRANTLSSTINWSFATFLFLLGVALVLDEVGISVTALVAGVGVVGVAVGLGAQTLVRDLIGGVFILVEDQFRVGDTVKVAGITGEVVEINPRRTVIRDEGGNVHSVPNGSISVATNMTQGFSRLNVSVTVPPAELERAIAAINAAGLRLFEERREELLTAPTVLRVDRLSATGVDLRVTADVKPGTQRRLTGELLMAAKSWLEGEGIALAAASEAEP